MKASNRRLLEWHMSQSKDLSKDEQDLLRGALIGAIKWGEKIDAENEERKRLLAQKGVTFRSY